MNISCMDMASRITEKDDAVRHSAKSTGNGFAEVLASETQREQEPGGAQSDGDYPLEAYSIPDWYADLYGGYTDVSVELGASYEDCRTGYDKLNAGDQHLYDEYADILHGAFQKGLDEIGVSGDTGKYYNDFVKNGDNQRIARESIYESLESNPRAVELMHYFDINIG